MKPTNQPVELIVRINPMHAKSKGSNDLKAQLKEAGIPVQSSKKSKHTPPASPLAKKFGGADETLFVKTAIRDSEMNPWDVAHLTNKALKQKASFIEPDLLQEFVVDRNIDSNHKKGKLQKKGNNQDPITFDPDWQPAKNLVWHLDDSHSQLRSARESVTDIDYEIRIAHLDTGYSKDHKVIHQRIKDHPLQRSFVDGEKETDAHDRMISGASRMPGHGTGTLGILAGDKVKMESSDGIFNDYLGAAYFADVICCRVASSVILMKNSAFSEAINYLTKLTLSGTPIHVVSMSMGGAPSKAWADAVNNAYDAGITMVTAAGNNFNGIPTTHVIFPARFQRVIAACGVTYDFKPYASKKIGEMQGCYGPPHNMKKALAAFTPNTPWAKADSGKISYNGAGTSSATPQIAATAALYYKKNHAVLDTLEPWQRVEAIRNALYRSARTKAHPSLKGDYQTYFGNGILQAHDALNQRVGVFQNKTPLDSIPLFPILGTLLKSVKTKLPKTLEMYNTELAQLVYHHSELSAIIDHESRPLERISKKKWERFKDAVIAHPDSSLALKKHLIG
jgi:hypothetical protein